MLWSRSPFFRWTAIALPTLTLALSLTACNSSTPQANPPAKAETATETAIEDTQQASPPSTAPQEKPPTSPSAQPTTPAPTATNEAKKDPPPTAIPQSPPSNTKALIGQPAPNFTLSDLHGQKVSLTSQVGKPVVINYWASWCPPCKKEMPDLNQFFINYQDRVTVLAINATFDDDLDRMKRYVASAGLQFPVLLDDDKHEPVALAYAIEAFPTTLFVDRDGIVRDVLVGAARNENDFIQRVEPLLK